MRTFAPGDRVALLRESMIYEPGEIEPTPMEAGDRGTVSEVRHGGPANRPYLYVTFDKVPGVAYVVSPFIVIRMPA